MWQEHNHDRNIQRVQYNLVGDHDYRSSYGLVLENKAPRRDFSSGRKALLHKSDNSVTVAKSTEIYGETPLISGILDLVDESQG